MLLSIFTPRCHVGTRIKTSREPSSHHRELSSYQQWKIIVIKKTVAWRLASAALPCQSRLRSPAASTRASQLQSAHLTATQHSASHYNQACVSRTPPLDSAAERTGGRARTPLPGEERGPGKLTAGRDRAGGSSLRWNLSNAS